MIEKGVLLSIKPKFCELIASGKKTIEVRKSEPRIKTPFKCFIYCTKSKSKNEDSMSTPKGKVIGEFVCKAVIPMSITYSNPNHNLSNREFPFTCLTDKEIMDYLGNGKEGYGWNISSLKIYDKPKELSEFNLTRPPQSWCYVEG